MKTFYVILATLLAAYAIYVTIFYSLQRRILFPVQDLPAHDARLIAQAGGDLLSLPMPFGAVEIAYLPPLAHQNVAAYPVILLAHGNGNVMDDWANRMDFMRQKGFAVVLAEYPGYGRSQGKPSYKNIKASMLKAYQWIEKNPKLDNQKVVLMGRSMGGGAVLTLIENGKQPAAIALLSTYSSIADLAKSRLIPTFLVRDPFDNVKALATYQGPSYLIHGTADKTVPFSMLQKLLAAAQDAKHKVYSSGHSDTPNDWPRFWHDFYDFLPDEIKRHNQN